MDSRTPGGLPSTIAGHQLRDELRTTAAGTWFLASGGDGRSSGVLLIDSSIDLAVLVATTQRLQALALPGVLMIRDLVELAGRVWLLTDDPPAPTLAQLIDAGIDGGVDGAARLAAELGDTVHALHQAGLVHGHLEPASVVVSRTGTPLLADWGTTDTATETEDDQAWAGLVWLLARQWCADDVRGGAALTGAAGAAVNRELADGLHELHQFLDGRPVTNRLGKVSSDWLGIATSDHSHPGPLASPPVLDPNPEATLLGARRAAAERRLSTEPPGSDKAAPDAAPAVAPHATIQQADGFPPLGTTSQGSALPPGATVAADGVLSFGPGWDADAPPSWPTAAPPPQASRTTSPLLRAYLKVLVGVALVGIILMAFLVLAR